MYFTDLKRSTVRLLFLSLGKNRQDQNRAQISKMPRPRASRQFCTCETGSWRQRPSILKELFFRQLPLACLRRAVKMALERHNSQTARYVPLASLPYGKLERTARCFSICTEQFPAGCFYITVKGIPAVQLARADREMGARGLEQLARPPPVFAVEQKQARLLVFSKLVAFSSHKKTPPET